MRRRLARKGRRVIRHEAEREFDSALTTARVERDQALEKANTKFRDGLKALQDARGKARKTAWDAWESKRAKIVKDAARADTEAA